MPIAKESGGDFTPVPEGTHVARCFACISLGTQESPMYPASFKVMLQFEIPDETIEIDGKPTPMVIGKEYTLSLSEKAHLRHDLQSWRGREFTPKELEGFAVETVIGAPCMLTVLHKTSAKKKVYAAITSISKLPKAMQCAPQHHKSVKFEIENGPSDTFNALPEWIRKKIASCEEWTRGQDQPPMDTSRPALDEEESASDSVPF